MLISDNNPYCNSICQILGENLPSQENLHIMSHLKSFKISEKIVRTQQKLITNHFTSFSNSLARSTGSGGPAGSRAAGVRGGGGGGREGTVQGTRAKHSSGLTGGNTGGQDRRFITGTAIGPGQTADRILTNPGQGDTQLILKTYHGATHATQ